MKFTAQEIPSRFTERKKKAAGQQQPPINVTSIIAVMLAPGNKATVLEALAMMGGTPA